MTRIATSLVREMVEVEPRRYMTLREKLDRWTECGERCMVCGKQCFVAGPYVIWDHRLALALGGTNDLSNMEPHHAYLCAALKTAADRKAIAKAKRLIAKHADPSTRAVKRKRKIESPGFQTKLTRGFDNKVKERKS